MHMHIVTGFIGGINSRKDRDLTKYMDFGRELLSVEIPTTCFIERYAWHECILPSITSPISEEDSFEYVCKGGVMDGIHKVLRYVVCGHVRFVFFEKEDLFLWPYQKLASKFGVNTGNPGKDTLGYMMVQCQKVEWVSIALSFATESFATESFATESSSASFMLRPDDEYVWIDFGAFHMFRGSVDGFQLALYQLRNRIEKRVLREGCSKVIRMAGCWEPYRHSGGDIYRDINWTFAGSVFGGGAAAIREFGLRMREKCLMVLRERNSIMWEINVWVLIFLDVPALFSWYKSDHSPVLFDGY
jgi:hypothetical protein